MKAIANPVEVEYEIITDVGCVDSEGGILLTLSNGDQKYADRTMLARMNPQPGDYLVKQLADGYVYLNPKDVFERKYRRATPLDMDPPRTRAQMSAWHDRIHEIAPWSWDTDPYLRGITRLEFEELRMVDDFDAWWKLREEGPK